MRKKKISTGGKNHILSALLACKTHNDKKLHKIPMKKGAGPSWTKKEKPLPQTVLDQICMDRAGPDRPETKLRYKLLKK